MLDTDAIGDLYIFEAIDVVKIKDWRRLAAAANRSVRTISRGVDGLGT
jgi:hypothetical protein